MDEREGRIGYWVSGVAHGSLILWAILGGALFRPQPSPMVRTTQVSTISGAEFEGGQVALGKLLDAWPVALLVRTTGMEESR